MPEYRVNRGTYRRSDGSKAEPGDTVELDEAFVDRFPGSKFERVTDDDGGSEDGDGEGDDADASNDGEDAVEEYVNDHADVEQLESDLEDEMSDAFEQAEQLADEHWRTAKSTVEDGDADEFLDELAHVEERGSVLSAIDERRAELED